MTIGLDGRKVIVFGGGTADGQNIQFNDVFILELSTMQWAAPSIEGVPPKPRKYHKCKYIKSECVIKLSLIAKTNSVSSGRLRVCFIWNWR